MLPLELLIREADVGVIIVAVESNEITNTACKNARNIAFNLGRNLDIFETRIKQNLKNFEFKLNQNFTKQRQKQNWTPDH